MRSERQEWLTRLLLLTSVSGPVWAQSVVSKSLGAPTAVFAEPFSRIGGVREQTDGRVVVLDVRDIRILRVDFRTNSATPLGRPGRGPGEYTLPQSLVGIAGDTSLAVDMSGGGRALVITRNGAEGSPIQSAGVERGKPLFMSPAIQADARGRLYELVRRQYIGAGAQRLLDSSGVRRLNRLTGRQDTLGSISRMVRSPLIRPIVTKGGTTDGGIARAGGQLPPFASVDQWAVAQDGRIALVSVEPYHVTYVSEDGGRTVGPPITYVPERVTGAQKARWRELRSQPVPTIRMGPNGSMAGGTSTPRFTEPVEWPTVLPPFLPEAVRFAPDGVLWIERTTAADAPQTFDLIDHAGQRASQVVLPRRSRLVGFGASTVYVVRVDSDDLEYLQRYVRP